MGLDGRPEQSRTGMRIGSIVLGLMILGLIVSGGVIVSGRLATGNRPVAGSPTASDVVGGGGAVAGSSTPTGGTLSVAGVGNERTLACSDSIVSIVSISGVGNTVVLTDHCARVGVSGVNNTVIIDEAGAIDVSGVNNKVVFHSGTTELSHSGFDNTLERG